MRADVFRETRRCVALLYQRVELTRTHFNDREFARDEESIEADERGDYRQFTEDNGRRVPLRDRRIGQKTKDRYVHCCTAACLVAERFAAATSGDATGSETAAVLPAGFRHAGNQSLRSELAKCQSRNLDRKSTRLNSSHLVISYAVFCLKKNSTH